MHTQTLHFLGLLISNLELPVDTTVASCRVVVVNEGFANQEFRVDVHEWIRLW